MRKTIALLAMVSLAASPAAAGTPDAAFASTFDQRETRASMFAGATLRIGLRGGTAERTTKASLQLSGMTTQAGAPARFSQGLELTHGRRGKPALHIAGQDIGRIQHRNNLSTGTAVAMGVGVALLAIVAVGVSSDWFKCKDEGNTCD